MGVVLVKFLQPWDILLIYSNNWFKKYIAPLLKSSKGATLCTPSDVYVRNFLCPSFTLIKLWYAKAFEWSSLVPKLNLLWRSLIWLTSLPTVKGSFFFRSSLAYIVCRLFDDGPSDQCEKIPHCTLDFHFSYN